MILEGLVTTISGDKTINVAPMGPHFSGDNDRFELRPFDTSQTYRNLAESKCGVLHVTDNVLLIAQCALHKIPSELATRPAKKIDGFILDDCCRWFEFEANEMKSDSPRKSFHCKIVAQGRQRDFYGFNRAKHSVIEATILATRIDFVPLTEILEQFGRLETIVAKTGGADEKIAFDMLLAYVQQFQSTSIENNLANQ